MNKKQLNTKWELSIQMMPVEGGIEISRCLCHRTTFQLINPFFTLDGRTTWDIQQVNLLVQFKVK